MMKPVLIVPLDIVWVFPAWNCMVALATVQERMLKLVVPRTWEVPPDAGVRLTVLPPAENPAAPRLFVQFPVTLIALLLPVRAPLALIVQLPPIVRAKFEALVVNVPLTVRLPFMISASPWVTAPAAPTWMMLNVPPFVVRVVVPLNVKVDPVDVKLAGARPARVTSGSRRARVGFVPLLTVTVCPVTFRAEIVAVPPATEIAPLRVQSSPVRVRESARVRDPPPFRLLLPRRMQAIC